MVDDGVPGLVEIEEMAGTLLALARAPTHDENAIDEVTDELVGTHPQRDGP